MTTLELTLLNAARKAAGEMGGELLRMSWFVSNWSQIDAPTAGKTEAA